MLNLNFGSLFPKTSPNHFFPSPWPIIVIRPIWILTVTAMTAGVGDAVLLRSTTYIHGWRKFEKVTPAGGQCPVPAYIVGTYSHRPGNGGGSGGACPRNFWPAGATPPQLRCRNVLNTHMLYLISIDDTLENYIPNITYIPTYAMKQRRIA